MQRIRKVMKTMRLMLQITWSSLMPVVAFRFPGLRKRFWTKMYNATADMFNDEYLFMNLGYASVAPDADEHPPDDLSQVDRCSERLYQHAIGEIPLQGKDVLEVGCGRGGGSVFLMRHYHPNRLIAVDIARRAIERCKVVHATSGIHFHQADAMALPFSADQFDVVINIESSHCYPSRKQFFTEVARVLRPGGWFLYADLVSVLSDNVTIGQVHRWLKGSDLRVIHAQNITANVLKSRDLLTQSGLFEDAIATWLREEMKPYRSVILPFTKSGYYLTGTAPYRCLKSGIIAYWSWILQKPVMASDVPSSESPG